MSVEAMSWAFAQAISPAPKLVLLAIANAANTAGYGFPSLDGLVAACQPMHLRMVQRHIRHLESIRLLRRTARFLDYGKQTSNGYQLAIPGIDTTGWGIPVSSDRVREGVISRGEGVTSDRERVAQLVHPDPVIAMTPTEDLNQIDERQITRSVGHEPDGVREGVMDLWSIAERILDFLNCKSGRHFKPRHPNKDPTQSLRLVHGLLVCGYREDQVKQVIGNRLVRWASRPEMREFLRPKTLFDPENFEQYLGQIGMSA
jgi:uncharacterized phage protein (TIGR02220 family)